MRSIEECKSKIQETFAERQVDATPGTEMVFRGEMLRIERDPQRLHGRCHDCDTVFNPFSGSPVDHATRGPLYLVTVGNRARSNSPTFRFTYCGQHLSRFLAECGAAELRALGVPESP